jgi:hypothetical protein
VAQHSVRGKTSVTPTLLALALLLVMLHALLRVITLHELLDEESQSLNTSVLFRIWPCLFGVADFTNNIGDLCMEERQVPSLA